jgi:hypothetical protein
MTEDEIRGKVKVGGLVDEVRDELKKYLEG